MAIFQAAPVHKLVPIQRAEERVVTRLQDSTLIKTLQLQTLNVMPSALTALIL